VRCAVTACRASSRLVPQIIGDWTPAPTVLFVMGQRRAYAREASSCATVTRYAVARAPTCIRNERGAWPEASENRAEMSRTVSRWHFGGISAILLFCGR
jgi:hypothetical protein